MISSPRSGASLQELSRDRGAILLRRGRVQEAIDSLEQALGESGGSNLDQIVRQLGESYAQAARQVDAFRLYFEAAWSHPQRMVEFLTKAAALTKDVNTENAVKISSYLAETGRKNALPKSSEVTSQMFIMDIRLAVEGSDFPRALELLRAPPDPAEKDGHTPELAKLAYRAGDACGNARDFDRSIQFLRLALNFDPSYMTAYWVLVEMLRLRAGQSTPPKLPDLEDAVNVWEEAKKYGLPAEDQSWCFLSRAAVDEQLVQIPGQNRWLLGWQSVCRCERSLLLTYDAARLKTLAQWYRFLNLSAAEAAAAEEAASIDSSDPGAQEVRIIWLTNAGKYAEVQPLIAERRKSDSTGWIDAVEAFVALHIDQPALALALIERAIKSGFDQAWCRLVRTNALQLLNRWHDVDSSFREMLSGFKDDIDAMPGLARANWATGAAEKAIEISETYLRRFALPSDSEAYITAGLSYLAAGKTEEGRDCFTRGLNLALQRRQLTDVLLFEFPLLEHTLNDQYRSAVLALMNGENGLRSLVNRRIQEIDANPRDALQELLAVQTDFAGHDPNGWMRLAVRAGEARGRLRSGDWQTAARLYAAIATADADRFPEARAGFSRALEFGIAAADNALQTNRSDAARLYHDVLASSDSTSPSSLEANAELGLACTHLQLGNTKDASQHLLRAIAICRQISQDWTGAASARIRKLIAGVPQFWQLYDLSEALATDAAADVRTGLPGFRKGLLNWLEDYYEMSDATTADRWPFVAPIKLQIGAGLIPEDPSNSGPLVVRLIPELRERIEKATGFRIPAVRVNDNPSLEPGGYTMVLSEVQCPLEGGTVPLDKAFARTSVSKAAALGISTGTAALDPLLNVEGCWLPRAETERLASAGIEVWTDPLEFVMRRLESVLLRHLAEFFGLDEAGAIFKGWQKADDTRALAEGVLTKPGARIHVARLLRCLIRDGVSLASYYPLSRQNDPKPAAPAILGAIKGMNLNAFTLPAAISAVRIALSSVQAGRLVDLPAPLQDMAAGFIFPPKGFARPDRLHELVAGAQDAVRTDGESDAAAIRVNRPEIGPLLRALLRPELPAVRIFTSQECSIAEPEKTQPALEGDRN